MTNETGTTDTDTAETAELLAELKQAPEGVTLVDWNPMESIPTLSVGKEITPGTVLNCVFLRTEIMASVKFTHSKTRNAEGVPTQPRHVFKSTKTGKLFAIWNTGELKMVCDKLVEGDIISLTYVEKGMNTKGQAQHFFEYQKAAPKGH